MRTPKMYLLAFPVSCLTSAHVNVKSLSIRVSAIGYIVKALAQIGRGEAEEAIPAFDLVFANSNPHETSLLLLIKVCDPCAMAGF